MRLRALLVLTSISVAACSQAMMWNINSVLTGLNENPPNASPATGIATGTLDDVTGMLHFDVTGSGFIGPITAAHIHTAPVGVNGPVTFALTGATGGTTYNSSDMFMLNPTQVTTLLNGGMYVNVHSQVFPGGEIRGQLSAAPVPEPASMLALAGGAAFLLRRRRRA